MSILEEARKIVEAEENAKLAKSQREYQERQRKEDELKGVFDQIKPVVEELAKELNCTIIEAIRSLTYYYILQKKDENFLFIIVERNYYTEDSGDGYNAKTYEYISIIITQQNKKEILGSCSIDSTEECVVLDKLRQTLIECVAKYRLF